MWWGALIPPALIEPSSPLPSVPLSFYSLFLIASGLLKHLCSGCPFLLQYLQDLEVSLAMCPSRLQILQICSFGHSQYLCPSSLHFMHLLSSLISDSWSFNFVCHFRLSIIFWNPPVAILTPVALSSSLLSLPLKGKIIKVIEWLKNYTFSQSLIQSQVRPHLGIQRL